MGTEAGYVGETNWSLLNATGEVPYNMLHYGVENGNAWVPAEVNTSIRPEWFYHPGEDNRVKTVPQLMETYYNSIGRNASLLLNFPIDTQGLIHDNDVKAALAFADAVKKSFAVNLSTKAKATASNVRGNTNQFSAAMAIDNNESTYWATDDSVTKASLTLNFGKPVTFNRLIVQEYINLGQRVKAFALEALVDGSWKELAKATTIGYKRILSFPGVQASKIRLNILDSKSCPVISNIGVYNAPQILASPTIIRNKLGEVKIIPADAESVVYYTLDETMPTPKSLKYIKPIQTEGKLQINAIAYEPASGKSSPVAHETFGISRKNWRILGTTDTSAEAIIDGNPGTAWHQSKTHKLPVDLVIDLGEEVTLTGFSYLPDQNTWQPGIISDYEFYISSDNIEWELADKGEFSNIKNNPLNQIRKFKPLKAHYIKLTAVKNTASDDNIGYAEVNIITD